MILSIRIFLNAALLSLGLLYQSHEAQATDPVVITDLNVSSKTPSSLSLTWNVSSGNKCNFIVRWTEGSVTYSNNTYNTSYTVTGLLAGMNYPINVIVENQTTGGAQISAFTNPNAVTNLNGSSKTPSSVSLTWDKPKGSWSYFLVHWTGGDVKNTFNMFYTVTNLPVGVSHTFSVTAVAADNQTEGKATQISVFTKPDAVNNLLAANKSSSSVVLTWNETNGSRSLFEVNWTDGSASKGSGTTLNKLYTATGLTAGVNYTFTVSAVAADNQTAGAPTQISAFTVPAVVSNLVASTSNQTTSSVSLTWNEPNGSRSFFIVNWTDRSVDFSSNTSDTSYIVTGLISGTRYTFCVTAVAADGQTKGAPNQTSAFTTPGVVANLTASSITTLTVTLNWNEPFGTRSHFIVKWTDGIGNTSSNTSMMTYNVAGLTAGTNYTFTVTAVAADNQTTGAPTQISAFTKPNTVTNLTVSNKTPSSISLNWNEPNGSWSNFIVIWTDGSEKFSNKSSSTSYSVTGLTAGVNYTFTVTAVAADGRTEGAPTQTSAFTKPNPITSLTASNKTTSSVSLTWNKPQGNCSFFKVKWTDGIENNSSNTSSMFYTVTGLTAGVNYTFTVTAVAADKQTEGAPTQILAFTQPNSVTNLIASNQTTSSVSLIWSKPQGSYSFFKVKWTGGSENNSSSTSSMFYTVTGLTAGVNYLFTVTALAADGQTAGDPTQTSASTNPDAVGNLKVSKKTTSSVSLTWNETPKDWSFKLEWTNDSTLHSIITSNTSYTITGLSAGVNYSFTVTAVAADNQTKGAPTQISTFTNPEVVTNLTVSNKNSSSVSLTWNEPRGIRLFFKVSWTGGSVNFSIAYNTSYIVTGLTAGVSYTFTVTAVAADRQTEGSPTQTSAFTVPNIVSNLVAANKTTSSVSLTWNEPQGNWSFFIVKWTDGSFNNSSNTPISSYNVTGLTAGVNYTFTVTAVAADGKTFGESIQISAFTKPDTVSNLTAVNVTTTSVLLYWTEAVGKVSHYVIQYENFSMTVNKTSKNSRIDITNLTPGVQYTFKVFAVAADNLTEGNYSCISAYTKPDVPRDLKVTEVTTSTLFLNWTQPIGERFFFKLQWSNDNMTLTQTTRNTYFNIINLSPGVSYTFIISAVAADNTTEGETISLSVYTKPDTVSNLTAVNVTTTSVLLYWTEAMGKVSHYVIQYENFSMTVNKTSKNSRIDITHLTPGVQYTFKVFAVAADNLTEGNYSSISAYTKPDVPRDLRVTEITTSTLFLNWTQPIGENFFFKLQWSNDNMTLTQTTRNTYFNIINLSPGVSYTFIISAVAADNTTEGQTISLSVYTKPDTVSNLTAVNVTTTSVLLYWTEAMGKVSHYVIQYENFSMTVNKTSKNTRIDITNLTPGVQYTFKVFAVAADNITEGNYSCISAYTKPGTIRNLKSSEVRTTSVLLDWDEPLGKWSFFRVLRINGGQWITSATAFNFTDLEPGTKHTFAVSAVAVDNITAGSLVVFSTCTGTSPILDLICEGPNRTAAALLNLTWTNPPGNNQGFGISLNQTTSDFVPRCNNVCSYIISKNLEYFSTYSLIISTLGCGDNGTQELRCRTGITEPPVPSRPEDMAIKVTPISQSIINLQLNASLLNADNGPIEAFGVLLSTDNQSNISSISLTKIYSQWEQGQTKAYLTVLKLNENKMTRSNIITIIIGNYSDVLKNTAYKNGPLSNQEYRVALVLFTYLEIKDELVDIQQSIFSLTPFAMNVAKPLDPSSNIVAIILGVLLPIIVLLIIAVIVLVIQKRRIAKEYTDIPVNNLRTKISIPVRVEDFEAYYKKQQLDSNCGFAEQYEDLKVVGTAQTKNSALAVENKAKNRYNNVLPYDSSRVKLSIHGSPFDDYINANYISGYNSKKEYIAAQGPLPATVNEFWRMIWEKHVHTIVMLTKCYEQGRVKCDKYWPPEAKLYSNIFVTTVSEIELEDWTIRDLTIKNVKTAETRNVRQFHFTAWPDHGVPETTEVLINFRHLVREHMDSFSRNAPAVVHCSAGVGRTGTFIALDHLIFQIERDSMVDIFGIIYDMRMHRPLMVQTEDQYVFLSQCASDLIKSRMGTNVDLIYQNAAAFSIYENVQK